jgi:hypothetical protein
MDDDDLRSARLTTVFRIATACSESSDDPAERRRWRDYANELAEQILEIGARYRIEMYESARHHSAVMETTARLEWESRGDRWVVVARIPQGDGGMREVLVQQKYASEVEKALWSDPTRIDGLWCPVRTRDVQ